MSSDLIGMSYTSKGLSRQTKPLAVPGFRSASLSETQYTLSHTEPVQAGVEQVLEKKIRLYARGKPLMSS